MPIEKLREIIYCKTPSEQAFSDMHVWLVMHFDVFSFLTLSVCEPTPGDYKFAKRNRTHFHWLAHYQRSCVAGLCNWINPSPIVTMVIKMKGVRRLCEWYVLQSTTIHHLRDCVKSCIIAHAWPCIICRET